jgi:hypothetical protein
MFGAQGARFRAIWPDTDAVAGITATVRTAQRQGDTVETRTGANLQASGRIPLQHRGKFVNVGVSIADNDWSYINGAVIEASAGALR